MVKGKTTTKKITIELTDKELAMIKESLNYYGDRVADTKGYGSGEKYWDLVEKLNSK